MTPEELRDLLTEPLDGHVRSADVAWGQLTVDLDAEGYRAAAQRCRDDERLDLDFFDCLFGVDEREEGFSVIANLYSTRLRHRVLLRHLCPGGRESPVAPSLTDLYRGADWHEREAWDMFGIEFDGHPGLGPRILTTENFEGWPLRKDFYLGSREAKPWPGIKEPLEVDESGQVVGARESPGPGGSPGPSALDEAMGEQARRAAGMLEVGAAEGEDEPAPDAPHTTAAPGGATEAHPDEVGRARAERARQKAAEARRQRAEERARAEDAGEEPSVERPDERLATAQDPRVTDPDERGEGAGPGAEDARRSPDVRPPGEETGTERAERAVREAEVRGAEKAHEGQGGPPGVPPAPERPQEQGTTPAGTTPTEHDDADGPDSPPPPQAGDEPAPGAEAGEPPTTQDPGEAPVDGGMQETVDREADAGPGPSGGERPGSTDAGDDTDEERS